MFSPIFYNTIWYLLWVACMGTHNNEDTHILFMSIMKYDLYLDHFLTYLFSLCIFSGYNIYILYYYKNYYNYLLLYLCIRVLLCNNIFQYCYLLCSYFSLHIFIDHFSMIFSKYDINKQFENRYIRADDEASWKH